MKAVIVLLCLILVGCTGNTYHPITLTTDDQKNIVASFYPAKPGAPGIILLHMLNKDRHTYDGLADVLNRNGYTVLSLDFRGHGQSDGTWQAFTKDDFQKMLLDVKAATHYLAGQQVDMGSLGIIGASIGANVALRYSGDFPVQWLVLLSPGMEYRGMAIEDAILHYKGDLLLVASVEDTYSATTVQRLHDVSISPDKELKLYTQHGHGTEMLADPVASGFVVQWVITHSK
ncbi:alpha/beta fold hydrolase [Candidatus Woesearchaeota archaeon]|nr:alpha/beta fold hydrolase [Candidatus Woesearchaeota archaeon]